MLPDRNSEEIDLQEEIQKEKESILEIWEMVESTKQKGL